MVEEFLTGTEMAQGIYYQRQLKKKKPWCTLHPLQVVQQAKNVSFSVGMSLWSLFLLLGSSEMVSEQFLLLIYTWGRRILVALVNFRGLWKLF